MSCAVCANNVESAVKKLPGVRSAVVNFAAENLLVEYDPTILSLEKIQAAVQAAGYDLIISEEEKEKQREAASLRHYKSLRNRMLVAWVFAIPLMVVSMGFMHTPHIEWVLPHPPYFALFGTIFLCSRMETIETMHVKHGYARGTEYPHGVSVEPAYDTFPRILGRLRHRNPCLLRSLGYDCRIRPYR